MTGTCAECGRTNCVIAARNRCSRCYDRSRPRITCTDCGKQKRPHKLLDTGPVCSTCWAQRNKVTCSGCAYVRPRVNRASDPPLCASCWHAARPAIDCAGCRRRRQPGGSDEDGRPVCSRCAVRRRGRIQCNGCGKQRYPHTSIDGGHLCSACSGRRRRPERCGGCGAEAAVVARAEDGTSRCHRCWVANHLAPCSGCGQTSRPVARRDDGTVLCGICHRKSKSPVACTGCGRVGHHQVGGASGPPRCTRCWAHEQLECARCGTTTTAELRWPAGPICSPCVDLAFASPQPCATCHAVQPNVAADGNPPQCPRCADLRFHYQCAGCGTFTRRLRDGRCPTCNLIDARQPDRAPTLDAYHKRVDDLLATVSEPARLVIRRYVRWAVTRPLQRMVSEGDAVRSDLLHWPLDRVRTATLFASAVTANAGGLTNVTQAQLDAWVTELPSHRPALRSFVKWAVAHDYMPTELNVPAGTSREQRAMLDDQERLALAQRLLREQLDDPPARLAAVLVLLFGQRITRLAALDVNAVTVTDDGLTALTLASTPIRLREPLAGLAREVADNSRTTGSNWLFPSSQGNRPLSGERLRDRAAKLGLHNALQARNGALAALAAHLPPALLAEQIGLSVGAAAKWSKAIGATRNSYVGLRIQ